MSTFSLFLARTAVTAWVGAAVLFVIVGISEVVHSGFSSDVRDQLVVIRFPWFYRFGFTLITVALIATLLATGRADVSPFRRRLAAAFLAAALLVMTTEYFAVYRPLAELVTPPGKPRTLAFMTYHRASMWVNFADLALCTVAMALLNWPGKPRESLT
jgi:hypothetical protein